MEALLGLAVLLAGIGAVAGFCWLIGSHPTSVITFAIFVVLPIALIV
jgi:hypothetical protein